MTGVWGILGGAAVGFLMGVPVGAGFLLVVALVLFVLTISGRFAKEREYSRGEGIVYLFAAPLLLFAVLPLGVGLLRGNPLLWQAYLGVFALLFVLSTVEFIRAARLGK